MEPFGATGVQAYPYGKDITRSFFALANDEPLNLPSQAPSIYLYSSQPSITDAANGTGAARAAVSYWTESAASPYPRGYTIPAIPDPQPGSSQEMQGWWLAINYILQASGDTVTKCEQIFLHRPQSSDSVPGTLAADITLLYPSIVTYLEDANTVSDWIATALDLMKIDLAAQKLEYHKIFELRRLKYALAFRTIAEFSISQIKSPGDRFQVRHDIYMKKYTQAMESETLLYDIDNSGSPDEKVQPTRSYGIVST